MSSLLPELIKKAREANGLTQAAFGKLFDPPVTQPTVGRWERGEKIPDRKHFPKIASLLNFTLEELFEFVEGPLAETGSLPVTPDEKTYIPNRKHLAVLNRGVAAWNIWREKNPEIVPQLAGAKLVGNDLRKIDLCRADLRGVDFYAVFLSNAELLGADLREAQLMGETNLSNSDLRGANLSKANLTNTHFAAANLYGANFSEACLKGTNLNLANLKDTDFSHADLTYVDLRLTILDGANFENAILRYCLVYGVSAWNVRLKGAVQKHLKICPDNMRDIYVDDLEYAYIHSLALKKSENLEIQDIAHQFEKALARDKKVFRDEASLFERELERKMGLKFDESSGGFEIEKRSSCIVLRHIYYWYYTNCCLIRIYYFQAKTIVIASQLNGPILWDEYLISRSVRKFGLDRKNLVWINHIGLFSNFRPTRERFIKTTIKWSRQTIFSLTADYCELCDEEQINLQVVEELIESKLEAVETWLGLDSKLQQEREIKKQAEIQKLLKLYLHSQLEFFANQSWLRQILAQAQLGAVFYNPEAKVEFNQKIIDFLRYNYLESSSNISERVALPFVEKYDPVTEMVVCVCAKNGYTFCEILSKSFLRKYQEV